MGCYLFVIIINNNNNTVPSLAEMYTYLFVPIVIYVQPIVEHDSVVWSPYTVKDIDNIESVQRRFTKQLPGFGALIYAERLRRLGIPSLELRRLHADLFYFYKMVFGYTDLQPSDFFEVAPLSTTRGHIYKLYKKRSSAVVQQKFFSERIVNILNNLPDSVDFSSVASFTRTVKHVTFSKYLGWS